MKWADLEAGPATGARLTEPFCASPVPRIRKTIVRRHRRIGRYISRGFWGRKATCTSKRLRK